MEMQPGIRAIVEEPIEQSHRFGQRAQIADHDAKVCFFAHRQLCGQGVEHIEFAQQLLRLLMKGLANVRQADPVAGAIQQAQTRLPLQLPDGRKNAGVSSMKFGRGRLKTALAGDGIKADQFSDRESLHVAIVDKLYSYIEYLLISKNNPKT